MTRTMKLFLEIFQLSMHHWKVLKVFSAIFMTFAKTLFFIPFTDKLASKLATESTLSTDMDTNQSGHAEVRDSNTSEINHSSFDN